MYTGGARRRLSHLWQLPLLLLSLILFFATAALYVDARPSITLHQRLSTARELLRNDRPEAAAEFVNRLMAAEELPREGQGQVHLLLAEALDAAQKQRRQSVPANHVRIIEQTQIALAQGIRATGDIYRRLGESYEALGKPIDAVSQYRQAIAIDPARALRLQRKVIDLQLAQNEWAPAESSLDAYLGSKEIADTERAWAQSVKAQLLIDRGEFADARRLLEQSLPLDNDPITQAEAKYRLGVCAWKTEKLDDADKLIRAARGAFRGQHPLDADAAYTLGRIAQEKNDLAGAIALFDKVIADYPESAVAPQARLARGCCRVQKTDDDGAVADLRTAAQEAKSSPALRDQTLVALRKSSAALANRGNFQAAIELLAQEQTLEANPPAGFFARLAAAQEKRAEQVEQSIADAAAPAEKTRRQQLVRVFAARAGDAYLACSKAKLAAGEKDYADALWKAIDQYDRAAAPASAVTALDLFVTERADDPIAPDALLRLARTHEANGQSEKTISAYSRLRGAYPKSLAAAKAALPLALLLERSPQSIPTARRTLVQFVDDPQAASRTPDDFHAALFELGSLCYRAGDIKEATPRLEQFLARFPRDEKSAEAIFLLGECYLAPAEQDTVQLASGEDDKSAAQEMERSAAQRKQRLAKAAAQFARCGDIYSAAPPTREPDRRYHMLAELRRADCAFELGDFDEALTMYQVVATRWPDDSVALAASVQVVNVYDAMNKRDDARTANERVRTLLARMPQGAFANSGTPAGGAVLNKAYWEQWLKWSGTATASTW